VIIPIEASLKWHLNIKFEQEKKMKICFFGVGGVGGYFGALAVNHLNSQHEIHFVARGKHKDAICANGLTLKKNGGAEMINARPSICTDDVSELPVCDLIILSVKGYDLAEAALQIAKITDEGTVILPLLNGVDIYQRIRESLQKGIVLQSCVYVGTHIESPGIIYQKGGNCKILAGIDPQYPGFYPGSLLTLLEDSQIDFSWEAEKVSEEIWSKYMFIAAYGLVTAAFEKSMGQIFEDAELSLITKAIMLEIEQIARKRGVALSTDIVEKSLAKGAQFPYETKTSFQRDVESKGKINEGDLFAGTVIRYGKELGIAVTNTENVYQKLNDRF
jgi:2-dehydropantoate 2-reductase